jgi:ABC-type transporter Mla MlaB component
MTGKHFENHLLGDREITLIRPRNALYSSLDRGPLDSLAREIDVAVTHEPPCDLIIDLSRVEAFGSAFVNLLIETSRRLQARGARLTVLNDGSGLIRHLGLDRLFAGQGRKASAARASR